MAKMTSGEFVKRLIDTAKNYKTLYVMGCFGAPMTSTNKRRYLNNHPYNKQPARVAMINAASADTFGFDCVCLLKGILWGWTGDKSKQYGGAGYNINGVPDINADTMIARCFGVTTDFSKITIGEALWCKEHIGVYIGDGLAVECTPKWDNGVQITAVGNMGKRSGYNTRTWTSHGKLPYIDYADVEQQSITPEPESLKIKVGSKVKVNKGAKTYTGGYLANFVYETVYDVQQIEGTRAVIGLDGKVTAAVRLENLILQLPKEEEKKEVNEVEFKIENGLTLRLKKGDVEKIEFVLAKQPTERIADAYKRIGCDVIFNANFFRMSDGATLGHVTDEGKVLSKNMSPFGYGFPDKKWAKFSYANNIGAPDFVGGYPALLRNGQIAIDSTDPNFSATSKVRRGRTAIGMRGDEEIIIRVIPDGSAGRKSIPDLAKEMQDLGCDSAINLDGGGSSQYITPWGNYSKGRAVDGFICIWLTETAKRPVKSAPSPKPATQAKPNDIIHIVKRGETLGAIGRRFGVPYTKIAKDNGIKNPNLIRVGQRLIIRK